MAFYDAKFSFRCERARSDTIKCFYIAATLTRRYEVRGALSAWAAARDRSSRYRPPYLPRPYAAPVQGCIGNAELCCFLECFFLLRCC